MPDPIDSALDPNLKSGQRAWVLGMLYALTGCNNPHHINSLQFEPSEIIGEFAIHGPLFRAGAHGKIDPKKQQAFAEKWRVWKDKKYFSVRED